MSWIYRLYETYNNCEALVGGAPDDTSVPLLPVGHTTQKAQLEIVVDENGQFRRARVVPKSQSRTIIPCTEDSGGRTSGEAAHPLCDKLQYVARDYLTFSDGKKSYFNSYLQSLEKWCASPYSHRKARAVLAYIRQGNVIRDLINHQVLVAGQNGKLISKWEKERGETLPPYFVEATVAQSDAFVRWIVEIPGELESRVWFDRSLWESWIGYYLTVKENRTLCYVSGKEDFAASQHPAKIRNDGDKAKLISSNDEAGYTFRGRFTTASQAAGVGFEVTQKAHAALRWLIARQGYRKGDLAIVAWATSGIAIPQPTDDPLAILGLDDLPDGFAANANTAQEVAIRLKKKIAGYTLDLGNTSQVVVIALNSATTGRLAITYYHELNGSDFLQRINQWHETGAWLHRYLKVERGKTTGKKNKTETISFVGAPAPVDIAEAAYGRNADDRVVQAAIARILPCIVEARPIPRDLVEMTVRRASNRVGLEPWEWNKTLSIACSLFKSLNRKENYDMALDLNRKTRDYLYGRLLALAESLEEWALNDAHERRETNAARLMQRFAEHPYTTWRTLELSLSPYKSRLGGKSKKRQAMIDEVIAAFNEVDFLNDRRLSGEFLLGYHCQRESLRAQTQTEKESAAQTND